MIDLNFYSEENRDFNGSDDMEAIKRLFDRQAALDKWLNGQLNSDEFLQVIEALDVSPDDYVDAVEGQLQEVGLWVP